MIARDNSSRVSSTTTAFSVNWNHTITANTDGLLVVYVVSSKPPSGVSVSYGGVPLTRAATLDSASASIWYLFAPAVGTDVIDIQTTTLEFTGGVAVSYTGVRQSGFPDAAVSNSASAATSFPTSITPVAAGAWAIKGTWNGGVVDVTLSSDSLIIEFVGGMAVADSNGTVSGLTTFTMTALGGGSADWQGSMLTMAPSGSDLAVALHEPVIASVVF